MALVIQSNQDYALSNHWLIHFHSTSAAGNGIYAEAGCTVCLLKVKKKKKWFQVHGITTNIIAETYITLLASVQIHPSPYVHGTKHVRTSQSLSKLSESLLRCLFFLLLVFKMSF